MIRRLANSVAPLLARVIPFQVVKRLLQVWALGAAATRPPDVALRQLIEIHDSLYHRIDTLSVAYGNGVHPKHPLTRYHDYFVGRIRPGERVLDVGCGKGEMAHDIVVRSGAEVVGIDVNPYGLAFARERFPDPKLSFLEADGHDFHPDRPFDVLVLSNVLEHIEHRVEFLRTLVERSGATRVLLRVPMETRDWLVPLRRELGMYHFSDPTHFIEYDLSTFEAELAEAGLNVVQSQVNWGEIWAEARTVDG